MNLITLREINNSNFAKIIYLSDTLNEVQKKCVAPNAISLAQAYLNQDKAWPRAIYLDETPIGFIMLNLNPNDLPEEDQPALDVWRLMIADSYQSKGYGKKVLDIVIQKARDEHKKTVYLSCDMESDMPYQFYIKYGFIDTHQMSDNEEILKIHI